MNENTNPNPNTNGHQIVAAKQALPANLPAGARAFQSAVDGMLTQDVWEQILAAQVTKAKGGDRGAAKFLLEYAGGVASMRGATFVQENHSHSHYHEEPASRLPASRLPAPRINGENPGLTPEQYEQNRDRNARRAAARVSLRD